MVVDDSACLLRVVWQWWLRLGGGYCLLRLSRRDDERRTTMDERQELLIAQTVVFAVRRIRNTEHGIRNTGNTFYLRKP
jgi:hypothetical protein